MDRWIDESMDPASHVSLVRDWLIPQAVQYLVAALANHTGDKLRDLVHPSAYEVAIERAREMHDTSDQATRDHLLNYRDWVEISVVLTALRCLEEDCRAGAYPHRLPNGCQGVMLAALEWQVALRRDQS